MDWDLLFCIKIRYNITMVTEKVMKYDWKILQFTGVSVSCFVLAFFNVMVC